MTTEEKFHAAVNVIRSLPKNGSYQPSNELMLRFYSYFKQATQGPCKGARPAFWDVVGRAKYDAWKKLGDMSKQKAMDSYVTELHRIVETMSYNDNIANFLEAQTELDQVPLGDLELIAGDVIERVRSQPNSPFASREASPTRLRSSLETSPASSPSASPPPQIHSSNNGHQETDHSDDEYMETLDSEPEYFSTSKKPLTNGYISSENIPNGHSGHTPRQSRSKTKQSQLQLDITQDIQKTIDSLREDLERVQSRMSQMEKSVTQVTKQQHQRSKQTISFKNVSPTFLAFLLLWPLVCHRLLRLWENRK